MISTRLEKRLVIIGQSPVPDGKGDAGSSLPGQRHLSIETITERYAQDITGSTCRMPRGEVWSHKQDRWREGNFTVATPVTDSRVLENGGSGGARTSDKSNTDRPQTDLPLQIASQNAVTPGHELSQVVAAWGRLPEPLKAAILAIINSNSAQREATNELSGSQECGKRYGPPGQRAEATSSTR